MISRGRITYLYRAGRMNRFESLGSSPTEFFYGLPQLKDAGQNVVILEDAALGMAPPLSPVARFINRFARFFGGLPVGMVVPLFFAKHRKHLCNSGIVIATTNSLGLALGIASMLGVIKKRVILLEMGLLAIDSGSWQRTLYRMVTRQLFLVSISRSEQRFLSEALRQPIAYLPFGVDKEFWSPGKSGAGDYVIAIGNDRNRDWETLVKAWNVSLPPLKIVTSLPVPSAPPNVEVVRGDWREEVLSDQEVRELLRGARFVVVPLNETIQPSGQSACLQAMACAKAVILSDISGIWDRDLITNGQTVLLTPPCDASALAERARKLADDPALAHRIGIAGRTLIEEHFNSDAMARALEKLLEDLNG